MNLPREYRIEQMRSLAASGMTYRQIAAKIGVTDHTVRKYCAEERIKAVRDVTGWAGAAAKSRQRAEQMRALYEVGYTLQQIGERFSLTRERVRQLMAKHFAITRSDGGQSRKMEAKAAQEAARRDARSTAKHGCSHAEYQQLRNMHKPTIAFSQQKYSAHRRGIRWELTIWEWWCIWRDSGHWDDRGRGQGYVMSRIADAGPYAVGNVYITTAIENSSEGQSRRRIDKSLPIGIRHSRNGKRFVAHRCINGVQLRLGTYDTVEEARAAWLRAGTPERAAA